MSYKPFGLSYRPRGLNLKYLGRTRQPSRLCPQPCGFYSQPSRFCPQHPKFYSQPSGFTTEKYSTEHRRKLCRANGIAMAIASSPPPESRNATVKHRANVVIIHLGTLVHTPISALHPSTFTLPPSSFRLHPSALIPPPSSFRLYPLSFLLYPSAHPPRQIH